MMGRDTWRRALGCKHQGCYGNKKKKGRTREGVLQETWSDPLTTEDVGVREERQFVAAASRSDKTLEKYGLVLPSVSFSCVRITERAFIVPNCSANQTLLQQLFPATVPLSIQASRNSTISHYCIWLL